MYTCTVIEEPKWWKHYKSTNFNAKSLLKILEKFRIQLGFEPRTFWLLVRHSYHWATGSLVWCSNLAAKEGRIDVNILRIEFKPRQWLGYTGKAYTTCKARYTQTLPWSVDTCTTCTYMYIYLQWWYMYLQNCSTCTCTCIHVCREIPPVYVYYTCTCSCWSAGHKALESMANWKGFVEQSSKMATFMRYIYIHVYAYCCEWVHLNLHIQVCESFVCLWETSFWFSTQGDFKEGIMHGRGIFTWTDGLIYEVHVYAGFHTGYFGGKGRSLWALPQLYMHEYETTNWVWDYTNFEVFLGGRGELRLGEEDSRAPTPCMKPWYNTVHLHVHVYS